MYIYVCVCVYVYDLAIHTLTPPVCTRSPPSRYCASQDRGRGDAASVGGDGRPSHSGAIVVAALSPYV